MSLDDLDIRLIELLTLEPGMSNVQAAKRLGVARHTVQSRLARMHEDGVVEGIVPRVNPAAFGYRVTALCRIQIDQAAGHEHVLDDLERIPEVIDLSTVSGDFDISTRVVARSHKDLQRVFDVIGRTTGVMRLTSSIVLDARLQHRTLEIVRQARRERGDAGGDAGNDARAGHDGIEPGDEQQGDAA